MSQATEWAAQALLATRKTLILGTVGEDGLPTASYAPFVRHNGYFYINVSSLSRHTNDMLGLSAVSVLLIEDESIAQNIFARKRITFFCRGIAVPRGTFEWEEVTELFTFKFGKIFAPIPQLSDFILFRLVPKNALYIVGFGQAYHMTGDLRDPVLVQRTGSGVETSGVKQKPARMTAAKRVRETPQTRKDVPQQVKGKRAKKAPVREKSNAPDR